MTAKELIALAAVFWVSVASTLRSEPSPSAPPDVDRTAATQAAGNDPLIVGTGIQGGLCLVIGAKSLETSTALARSTHIYVQVLQPDWKIAAQWGGEFSRPDYPDREKIAIRCAAFDPDHYGTNLFNLVVVEDASALGKAKLADLCRILVPNGAVALKAVPKDFVAEAKALAMATLTAEGFAVGYRKPIKPAEWKLPLETKWQAGPRSQISNGYAGICAGDGKLFYLEQMERNEGDLADCAAVLFARDAYNGRTLWTWELPGRYSGMGLAATSTGRLFVKTGTGLLLCLDGNTGKTLFEVARDVHRESGIWLLNDDLLSIHGDVRSAQTGKPLWRYPSLRYQPLPGTVIGANIYFCDGTTIFARKLADGQEVWKVPTTDLPLPARPESLSRADQYLLVRTAKSNDESAVAALDAATGKLLWSYTWKVRTLPQERYFNAGGVRHATADGKLLLYYRHDQANAYADEVVATRIDLATGKVDFEDRIVKEAGDYHGCFSELHLGDYIAYYDLWVNKKTLETTRVAMPHPACFFGMSTAFGMVFNFPSRKSGPISAAGPADAVPTTAADAVMQKFGAAGSSAEAGSGDWPMFRGGPAGGNAARASLGGELAKAWESQVGAGSASFAMMSSQRTGLSQAVAAYGLAVVSDIDGQRIVALNMADGKPKWAFHVGSRVDYPPTLYRGLCLFAARDGWVYCLDAATGQPVYRLPAGPRERYIGGREKLESRWPLQSDVLIANGVAYVAGGEGGGLAFKPETGERVGAKDAAAIALGYKGVPGGRDLRMSYDLLLKGNSIPRTNEDNAGGFTRAPFGDKLDARVLAFDDKLTVAYQFRPAGEGWANKGTLTLKGVVDNPAKPKWSSDPIELVVDDLLLTPDRVFCVGHYQRVKKAPELWVISRDDGKVLATLPVDGFPAFMGMSAVGNKLFIATREGKLLCYAGK
ncbi:MAG: PQQ-binding-like beta-propeller repeat protein [Phycisphaerae bacterium]|nr:PQQ-binding-like beta-propeller repeat protein [Phycisphaerae bacterium]